MNTRISRDSLSTETETLEQWYRLLGELTDCLWYSTDLPTMLQSFCRILVERGRYASAELVYETDNQSESYQVSAVQAGDQALNSLSLGVSLTPLRSEQAYATLTLSADFDLDEGSDARQILDRLVKALGEAIVAFLTTYEHHILQDNLALSALLVKQSPFSMLITDAQGEFKYCNASYLHRSGFTLEELIGRNVLWSCGDTVLDLQYRAAFLALTPGQYWHGDIQSYNKEGARFRERQVVSPLNDDVGRITHLVAVRQEISDELVSHNGVKNRVELEEVEQALLLRDDLAQPDLEEIRTALREKREGRALLRNYRKDGTQFWNELHISPVKDATGASTTHFVSVINDVSERVNYQRELEYQATHDSLTGLANRNLLNDRITQAISWAKRQNFLVGLMLLDLDHFKLINDASGHGAGDEMLKQVAQRLTQCVRDTDTVARLGGDEFVIVLTDLQTTEDIDAIAAKILESLSRPIIINGHELFVTASIGISVYPRDGDHGEILLRYADIAMYRVKEHGRNSVRQFMPEMGLTA